MVEINSSSENKILNPAKLNRVQDNPPSLAIGKPSCQGERVPRRRPSASAGLSGGFALLLAFDQVLDFSV